MPKTEIWHLMRINMNIVRIKKGKYELSKM